MPDLRMSILEEIEWRTCPPLATHRESRKSIQPCQGNSLDFYRTINRLFSAGYMTVILSSEILPSLDAMATLGRNLSTKYLLRRGLVIRQI